MNYTLEHVNLVSFCYICSFCLLAKGRIPFYLFFQVGNFDFIHLYSKVVVLCYILRIISLHSS